jgi:hypothetical protein
MIYRAREKKWVLHANLACIGATDATVRRLRRTFANDPIDRPFVESTVRDKVTQLSYVAKFGTYHRPFKQTGSKKSRAVPLNPPQHYDLVWWMSQFDFSSFMFLWSCRRQGTRIILAR